jgi:uncharacterized protein YndB with AHSA1/START domain
MRTRLATPEFIMAPSFPPTIALTLRRAFSAPPERVFRAWTSAEELRVWFGPGAYSAPHVELDLRVGGRYRIGMQPPEGEIFYLAGEYVEIDPPRKLVFTWQWEGDPAVTLVTLEFLDQEGMTELIVTHERFPTQEQCERHKEGWSATLEKLPGVL